MMLREEPLTGRRWGIALGLVVLAHGGLIAYLRQAVTALPEPAEKPAVLIDLEPLPLAAVANVPSPTEARIPQQPVETPPPPDETPPPDNTPPPPDDTPPPVEAPSPAVATVPPTPVAEAQLSDVPAPVSPPVTPMPPPEAAKPAADLPKPPKPRRRPPQAHEIERQAAPAPASPITSPPAATPAPVAAPIAAPSAQVSWQSRLIAHLNRYKRFPPEAQMRQRQGTALVHVRLMPDGSAEDVRLQRSSGTDSLDQEAVALIARAAPLPVPDTSTGAIEIEMPIVFMIK